MSENKSYLSDDDIFGQQEQNYLSDDDIFASSPAKDRGLLGDIGANIGRGAADTAELAGHALKVAGAEKAGQWLVDKGKAANESNWLKPDEAEAQGTDGYVKTGVMSGLRSAVPSLAAGIGGGVAGAKAGAVVGSVIPGVGTAAGAGVGGLIGGALGALGLFGAGIYGKEKQRAVDAGLDDDTAHKHGMEQAFVEGGIEALATPIEMMTMGFGKAVTKPLKNTIKELIRTPGKKLLENYAKTAGVETSTEMLQSGLGNELAKKYGLNESETTADAVIDSIIPALTMSLMFGAGSHAYTAVQQKKLRDSIVNGQADPQERANAANTVWHEINKYDPELAQSWRDAAQKAITDGTGIDIDEDFSAFAASRRQKEQASQPPPANTVGKISAATGAAPPPAPEGDESVTDAVPSESAPPFNQTIQQATEQQQIGAEPASQQPISDQQLDQMVPESPAGDAMEAQAAWRSGYNERSAEQKSIRKAEQTYPDFNDDLESIDRPIGKKDRIEPIAAEYGQMVAGEIEAARGENERISIRTAVERAAAKQKNDLLPPAPIEAGGQLPTTTADDLIINRGDVGNQPFGSKAAAKQYLAERGMADTHEVIPAREVGINTGGFVGRNKTTPQPSSLTVGQNASVQPAEMAASGQRQPDVNTYTKETSPYQVTKKAYVDGHYRSPSMHKTSVEEALKNGLEVDSRVIADYPDLSEKYGKVQPNPNTNSKADLPGAETVTAPANTDGPQVKGNAASFTNPAASGQRQAPDNSNYKRGKEGEMLSAGEVRLTATGRKTTPFPKIDIGSNRKATNTIKRVDQWLMDNAIAESKSRGDEYNLRMFMANRDKPSQADKDSAEMYLFGEEQPPVPTPLLKDMTGGVAAGQTTERATEDDKKTGNVTVNQDVTREKLDNKTSDKTGQAQGATDGDTRLADAFTDEQLSMTVDVDLFETKDGKPIKMKASAALQMIDEDTEIYRKLRDCVGGK